ncbi:GAP family protein [Nocardioides sp. CN2-186]|uniref:GAP family protein n=1 Tax=Nocardioides tweenelious TaxID=3156607 RepID=UPI0032B5BB5A
MTTVIGDLLPLALGVAISPIPVIATVLMLLAPQAKGASLGFLLGWLVGIVVATTVFVVIAATTGLDSGSSPSAASAWIKIGLGVLLLLVGAKQWRGRPRPGEVVVLPKWMAAIDSFTFVKAAGLGFLLAAVNPKNLLMCVAAGSAIGGSGISTGDMVVAAAVFTVIAASTVAVPVIGYLVAHERMRNPLDELRVWLGDNNATVMSVLVLVIGVVLIGKGIGGL